jgi:hypothetical protein
VGSIPANPDAQNVPSFRRWRFEMKLSPFFFYRALFSHAFVLFRLPFDSLELIHSSDQSIYIYSFPHVCLSSAGFMWFIFLGWL